MSNFWNGFEKQAKISPGGVLNYAEIRAAELAKKRGPAAGALNYQNLAKPKTIAPKPVPAPKSAADILKERQQNVARGGLPHSTWQELVKK